MRLSAAAVSEVLNEITDHYWGELAWELSRNNITTINIDGVDYPIEILEEEDGGDREWEYDVWIVLKVGDQIFKVDGTYYSHEGTEWGELREVEQKPKTVMVWENV